MSTLSPTPLTGDVAAGLPPRRRGVTRAALHAEVRKLTTTRLGWGVALVGAAIAVLYTGLYAGLAGQTLNGQPSGIGSPTQPAVLRLVYAGGVSQARLLPLILGIVAMAGEFRQRTLTDSLLAVPRRGRFLAAKATVLAAAGAALGVIFAALAVGTGAAVLAVRGLPLGLDAPGLPRALALTALDCGVWAVIGFGLGALLRSQVVALAVALVSQMLLEGLLALAAGHLPGWVAGAVSALPGMSAQALVQGADSGLGLRLLPWWGAGLALLGWAAALGGAGALLTARRDVS